MPYASCVCSRIGEVQNQPDTETDTESDTMHCTALHCITLYLIEVYEVQGPALHHGLLRVHHGEQKGVEALVLVQTSCANGLERGERVGDYSHSQVGLEEGREQCS